MSLKQVGNAIWRFFTWPFRKLLQCFGCCLPTQEETPPEQKAVEEKKKPSLNPALIQNFPPRRRRSIDQQESVQPATAPIWTLTRSPPREPATAPPVDHDIDPYMRRLEEIEKQLEEMSRAEHKRQRIAYRTEIMKKIEQEKRKRKPPSPQFVPYDSDSDTDKEKNRV